MTRCAACPLADGVRCPSEDNPRLCVHAGRESHQPDPRQHYWLDAIRRKAGEPPRPRPGLPEGFPSREPARGRVRAGLVAPCAYRGGAEAVMLAQLRHVDSAKVAWTGCAVLGGEGASDPGMIADLGAMTPVAFGRAAAVALARECDVLIVWAVDDLPAILDAAGGRRPKVINVCHSPVESPWGIDHNARASGVDRWVAVSELALPAIPQAARENLPTSVIWNAVDTARLAVHRSREDMHRSWGVPPGALVAGYLGRLSAEKDPHAMRRLIGHLPEPWHAVVVGAGAEVLDSHPRLHVVGNDPAAGDCLNAFDCLIIPSHYESFGLTLAEGLWMGVPVVSTPVGIEKLWPGLTWPIPTGADGPTLAVGARMCRAYPEKVAHAKAFARKHLGPDRFGREWTDLIISLAPAPVAPPAPTPGMAREIRLSLLRNACRHASRPPGCGCNDTRSCGKVGREVTRAECFACLAADKMGAEAPPSPAAPEPIAHE